MLTEQHLPPGQRAKENLHIIFWLLKDVSWCLNFKVFGVIMVVPTLVLAIIITARSRSHMAEFCHNLAIVFWITANAYWMIVEFTGYDEHIAVAGFTYRQMTFIPFVCGLGVLAWYYAFQSLRKQPARSHL